MADNTAFALGLITSALQWIMVMLSWFLTTYLGRRTILYVDGRLQFIRNRSAGKLWGFQVWPR